MEINLNTYNEIIKWSYSKEGILVILVVMYFAWFLIPAIQVSFFDKDGEKTDLVTKLIVFVAMFVFIPPLLILGHTLNFLGLLSGGSE